MKYNYPVKKSFSGVGINPWKLSFKREKMSLCAIYFTYIVADLV
jgi:hypothetical protein